jgi:hypothetical protein
VPGDEGTRLKREHPNLNLQCAHCERIFQARQLKLDQAGLLQGCPNIANCGGAGIGVDIHPVRRKW